MLIFPSTNPINQLQSLEKPLISPEKTTKISRILLQMFKEMMSTWHNLQISCLQQRDQSTDSIHIQTEIKAFYLRGQSLASVVKVAALFGGAYQIAVPAIADACNAGLQSFSTHTDTETNLATLRMQEHSKQIDTSRSMLDEMSKLIQTTQNLEQTPY